MMYKTAMFCIVISSSLIAMNHAKTKVEFHIVSTGNPESELNPYAEILVEENALVMPFDRLRKFKISQQWLHEGDGKILDNDICSCTVLIPQKEIDALELIERARGTNYSTYSHRGGVLDRRILGKQSPEFLWHVLQYVHGWQETEPKTITSSLLTYLAETDIKYTNKGFWWKGKRDRSTINNYSAYCAQRGNIWWHNHNFKKHEICPLNVCKGSREIVPTLAVRYCQAEHNVEDAYTKEHVQQFFEHKSVKGLFWGNKKENSKNNARLLKVILEDDTQLEVEIKKDPYDALGSPQIQPADFSKFFS